MPYKDPEQHREMVRRRRAAIRANLAQWEAKCKAQREGERKRREQESPDEREARLTRRRAKYLRLHPGSQPRRRFANDEARIAYWREYARQWASRRYQANPEQMIAYNSDYWRNTTPERKAKRRQKKTATGRIWRMAHPDAPAVYYRRNKEKWTNGVDCRDPKVWQAAEVKARELIERLGYTATYSPEFKYFYFDLLAKKDGRIAAFQVTTLRTRLIKWKHIDLVRYLDWDYFIVHVKPTLDMAYLGQIDVSEATEGSNVHRYFAYAQEYAL